MADISNESQIRTLVEEWAKAVRAGDMPGVLANHTDDVVMFDVPLPLVSKGLDEYRKTWELFFKNSPGGDGSFDPQDLEITTGDTVAFCHGLVRIFDDKVRLSMGLRKVGGQWLISHEHHSYPIELEQ